MASDEPGKEVFSKKRTAEEEPEVLFNDKAS
jgi:hypothetical protein